MLYLYREHNIYSIGEELLLNAGNKPLFQHIYSFESYYRNFMSYGVVAVLHRYLVVVLILLSSSSSSSLIINNTATNPLFVAAWTISTTTNIKHTTLTKTSSKSRSWSKGVNFRIRRGMDAQSDSMIGSNDGEVVIGTTTTALPMITRSLNNNEQEYVKIWPNAPIPPPICSNIEGTWAYDTMSRRIWDDILNKMVLKDNDAVLKQDLFIPIRDEIIKLRTELQFASTTPLTYIVPSISKAKNTKLEQQQHIDECEEWNQILQPYIINGETWLSAPWLVTEFYMYRRLMSCYDYWNKDAVGYLNDPFLLQKQNGLYTSKDNAEPVLFKLANFIQQIQQTTMNEENNIDDVQKSLLYTGLSFATQLSLWGNKMDLSLWPADMNAATNPDIFYSVLEAASSNLLHDDSPLLNDYCIEVLRTYNTMVDQDGSVPINIDIVVDNAGFELVTDLALATFLIEAQIASTVTFQMKSHPTFVSDALEKDLLSTIEYYMELDETKYPTCVLYGNKWNNFISKKQWICNENRFWVQPLAMWDMYPKLYVEIQKRCHLTFVKGDANYRRLLGDRIWNLGIPFEEIVGCYYPTPICALRTLKAEIGCGMDVLQTQRAASIDKNWMTNGRFGVIHYGKGATCQQQK